MNLSDSQQVITDYVTGIFFGIHNDQIKEAKELLSTKFKSQYNNPPHFTLMFSPIILENLEGYKQALNQYLATCQPFTVSIGEMAYHSKRKFYWVKIDSPILRRMHLDLLRLVQPFRAGHVRQKDLDRLQTDFYSPHEVSMIEKWGYPLCDECFEPHITLGNVEDQSNFDEAKTTSTLLKILGNSQQKQARVDSVEMAVSKDLGTHSELQHVWHDEFFFNK